MIALWLIAAVLAHEAAHALAALALGYRVSAYAGLDPLGVGVRVRDGRRKRTHLGCALFLLAGPIANLALAAGGIASLLNLLLGTACLLVPLRGGDGHDAIAQLR